MANVSESKKKEVQQLTKLIEEYPIVGVVNMENLPAKQLQIMREKLRENVLIRMSKGRLIKIALTNAKKEHVIELTKHLKGMPALLFTRDSPFKLFKTLKKNKSKTAIKAGQKAPSDIVVPAGPTPFAPGPIIGELGALKIKAGIEGGKVAIKEDALVAKEGDVATEKLAGVLSRLGIEPMLIGLDLVAAYENGDILTKEVLDVDEDAYLAQLRQGHREALTLALETGYPTGDTILLLVQKAFTESKTVALETGILNKDTINELLAKAEAQAAQLNTKTAA